MMLKFRYLHSLLFSCIAFTIITTLICLFGSINISGVTLLNNSFVLYLCLGLAVVGLLITLISLKKTLPATFLKVVFILTFVVAGYLLCDLVILGLVRGFMVAYSLESKPNSTYPLMVRIAYIIKTKYSMILNGVWTTLWLSLLGTIFGLILGLVLVILRTLEIDRRDQEGKAFLKKIGHWFANIYITVFRGTPMLVQAIIIYYFLPGILAGVFGIDRSVFINILTPGVAGLITVSLNTTAYLSEVLRGGIEAINVGQMEAARSLGMSRTKAMLHIIFPQAIKNSLPAICNEFIINIKDTSVLSVISVMDLFFMVNMINGASGNQDAIFIAAAIYLVLTYGIAFIMKKIEHKMNLVAKPLPSSN
jgi:His/Glu/Gln/Arg/opine family amino acid ABC transporter permease subunit